MTDKFQQTVNLKDKLKKKEEKKKEGIERIYEEGEKFTNKIERPKNFDFSKSSLKKWLTAIIIIAVLVIVYFVFFDKIEMVEKENQVNWYAVKLTNNEIYYGKISDTSADPIIIENVYYDYDQINNDSEEKENLDKSIRLVKRGKETQGGDGTMSIVRAQVVTMEPLREDSKILQAILNYEN